MIFSEGEYSIEGFDPRFLIILSAIDYFFLYKDGILLSYTLADKIYDYLPFWLAFLPSCGLLVGGTLLMLVGPGVLFVMLIKG